MSGGEPVKVYQPRPHPVYEKLYELYRRLSKQFAHDGTMRALKEIRDGEGEDVK